MKQNIVQSPKNKNERKESSSAGWRTGQGVFGIRITLFLCRRQTVFCLPLFVLGKINSPSRGWYALCFLKMSSKRFALGIGAANLALFNVLLDAVFIRCLLSYLLAFDWGWGYMGIYIGQALSPILPALVGAVYFKSQMWEKKRLLAKNEQE